MQFESDWPKLNKSSGDNLSHALLIAIGFAAFRPRKQFLPYLHKRFSLNSSRVIDLGCLEGLYRFCQCIRDFEK